VKYATPIIYFLFGAFGLFGACGRQFYGGGLGKTAIKNPVPKWFGRLWFLAFFAWAAYMGVKALLSLRH
jgi:hypothetical protein